MAEQPSPGGELRALNQGLSNTCTCHALTNAIAKQLARQEGIDVVQELIVGALVSYNGHIGPIFPHSFDNFQKPILTMDQDSEEWIEIRINTVEEKYNLEEYDPQESHVLAYFSRKEKDQHGNLKWKDYHCVFVERRLKLRGNAFECVNSYGNYEKRPVVELNRPGNRLWVVRASWDHASEVPSDYDKITKLKIFYLKIDLIGETYDQEYENKSSEQFTKLSTDIIEEVAKVYSKDSVAEYKKIDVLNVWRGSVGAKENEEEVLFVELVLNMETTRSHALAPLRTSIVNGKLGEFKVADYLDICEATLDPINGTISSKVYTVEGETKSIDDITKYIRQNHGIEETEYISITEKEENMEKAKLFYNFILKSERKGFEFLLRAIQDFAKNSNSYKKYGECLTGNLGEYPMNTGYKGIFLLIDNKDTAADSVPQQGKIIDPSRMKELFQELNFIVCEHDNLTVKEMRDVFKYTVSMYADDAYCGGCNFTAFAACILTKGGQQYKDFYGADNTTMEMKDFVELMKETPLLRDIPKLVIFHFFRAPAHIHPVESEGDESTTLTIQNYTGLNENCDTVVTSNNVIQDGAEYLVLNSMDVEPGSSYWKNGRQRLQQARRQVSGECLEDGSRNRELFIPEKSNFLVFVSSVAGYYSLGSNEYSSWFIHALIEEFRTNGSRNDVTTILESVEEKILTKLESWREEGNTEELFVVKELTRTLYLN